MESISFFKDAAPYLTNPLVLSGFLLLLLVSVFQAMLKRGVIPRLTPRTGGRVVQNIVRYLFILALVAILLGFGITFFQTYIQHDPNVQKAQADRTRLEGLTAMAQGFCQRSGEYGPDESIRRDAIKACAEAIHALAQIDVPKRQLQDALAQLEQGNALRAKALFQEILERKITAGKAANQEAAEAARHLGALAYSDNTKEALLAYQKSVELDPDSVDAWTQLGHLLLRLGKLSDAEKAYGKVSTIGESQNNKKTTAIAFDNLGNLYRIRGDLARAEALFKKALAINEELGLKVDMAAIYSNLGYVYISRGDSAQAEVMYKKALVIYEDFGYKEGIAFNYANLGNVHLDRMDLVQAEAMYKKSLAIDEALGKKEGMATTYSNLGNLYQIRGDLARAEAMYKKSVTLFKKIGATALSQTMQHRIDTIVKLRSQKSGSNK